MKLDFYVPCLFGLEGLVADELRRLKMASVTAENGHVLFSGTDADIARANINLACGERVLLVVGSFPAPSFEALFDGVSALPWEMFIPRTGAFPVKGYCLNSQLHSVPDCQKIIKKAVASRLMDAYAKSWLEESGEKYQIQFSIVKDRAMLFLDTTGAGLYKRGYRTKAGTAPLRETLAAALVRLSRYRGRDSFLDPFCGSGTIVIEAALAAKNRAPGLLRGFAAQSFAWMKKELWMTAAEEARAGEYDGDYDIWGGDIDPACISLAMENAERAGVDDCVRFAVADARKLAPRGEKGVLVTNPPYGERLLEKQEAEVLYADFGRAVSALPDYRKFILSSHTEFERSFGKPADKKRKLYNGMIKCDLFMYF